jgi:hypothetical protein
MFDYIRKSDVIRMQTVTVPRVLFSSQRFQELSPMAKILYAMLREALEDEDTRRNPHMYTDICMDLNSTADEVAVWMRELAEYQLVTIDGNSVCVHDID